MPYSVITVANTLLEKSVSEDEALTHMKLQKMAYCLHGWHLAVSDAPACAQLAEAWKYGPVWSELYHALKHHGHELIRNFVTDLDENGRVVFYTVPKANREFHEMVEEVWRKYAPYSAVELSEMTHKPGTPWAKARALSMPFISNDHIRDHFREIVGGLARA